MSEYIQFFIRHNDDFIPILTYSRNNPIFRIGSYYDVPYEKIIKVNENWFHQVIMEFEEKIEDLKTRKKEIEYESNQILSTNNSLEEKMEFVRYNSQAIREIDYEIELHLSQRSVITVLYDMYENFGIEEVTDAIYVGIEIGVPTIDDIVK